MSFTKFQLSVSTAEDELNYFSGSLPDEAPAPAGNAMPTGTYRVVDGSLYLVLPQLPRQPSTESMGGAPVGRG